jgi:hypothetical protein
MRLLPGVVFKEETTITTFPPQAAPAVFLFLPNKPCIFAERLDEQSITQRIIL